MGRAWNDSIPAHQIDRKKFDTDMYEMNIKSGIKVMMNTEARDIVLDRESGHRVTTSDGKVITCKWLVDATGFAAPLARKLDLIRPIERHPISCRWARIKNINALDHLGSDEWRARVNFNSRFLSTVHFMYPGYWFWVIPLDENVTSIGVVWQHEKANLELNRKADFIDFMLRHTAISELLGENFELLDFHGLKRMSRMSQQFYSTDRWFLTGMSAAFLDPLFSSGSAFLSDVNRMIVDLIETDMAGDTETLQKKVVCYNVHSRWWLENFLLHITGNYHGSYDLMRQLFEPLLMDYFGLILPVSMSRQWGYDPSMDYGDGGELLARKMRMIDEGPARLVHRITEELADFLKNREGLFANNEGKFFDLKITKDYIKNSLSRGRNLSPEAIGKLHDEMLEISVRLALERMASSTGKEVDPARIPMAVHAIACEKMHLAEVFDKCVRPSKEAAVETLGLAYASG